MTLVSGWLAAFLARDLEGLGRVVESKHSVVGEIGHEDILAKVLAEKWLNRGHVYLNCGDDMWQWYASGK